MTRLPLRPAALFAARFAILLLAAGTWPLSLQAQKPGKPAGWVAEFENTSCNLSRYVGPEAGTYFRLEWTAGGDTLSILIGNSGWQQHLVRGEQEVMLVTTPGGSRTTALAYPLSPFRPGKGMTLPRLETGFLDALAKASELSIEVDGKTIEKLALPQAATAVKTLRQCNESLLRAFGVDPDFDASLRSRPKPIGGSYTQWVTDSDYPSDALRRGASGAATVRLTIGTNGRVRECAVAGSSGDSSLDRQTCALLQRRGRFEPAVAADGSLVEAAVITTVRWFVSG